MANQRMAHLSVVTSIHDDAECLPELHRRLGEVLAQLTDDYEIVLVDDGSRDDSWQVIARIAEEDRRVKALRFSRNFGQHYGLTAGLDHCDGDWVVVMDGDLQDRPEEIPRLYAKALEGHDVVLARRGARQDPAGKRLLSRLFFFVFNRLSGMRHDPQVANFRIVSRAVVESFRPLREQLRFVGGILDWTGFRQASIDVRHASRHAGSGSYGFGRRWRLAEDMLIAHSDRPFRLAVLLGALLALAGLALGAFVVVRAATAGTPAAGGPAVLAALGFVGGTVIALLGLLGIYLARTLAEARRRPLYVVREKRNL